MKKLIYILLPALLMGCDDFTEVDLPNNQLTSSAVFESEATATAAMTDIYTKMREGGILSGNLTGISNQLGLYADELDFYAGPGSLSFAFSQNALQPASVEVQELWNSTYSQIYAANAVLEGVSPSTGIRAEKKSQLTGEALLVRGLLHFYLTGLFGDVPYIKGTDYQTNRNVHRLTYDTVLEMAAEDLNQAAQLLPPEYVSMDRTRPNKYAAYAYLARVRLYQGNWSGAYAAANEVIGQSGMYPWVTDLEQAYLKEATTTIWQFAAGMQGNNTQEATTFSFESGPPPLCALSENFLQGLEQGDLRRDDWIRDVAGTGGPWSHIYKYRQPTNTGSSLEYSILVSTPELYLIRAESLLMQGDHEGALEDINRIRMRAGLPASTATGEEGILNVILRERRMELACEFGHRFFDLKRLGRLDAILGTTKPGWNTNDRLLPVPERELLLNPNLAPQNNGY